MKNIGIEIKWGVIFFLSGLVWMWIEKSLGWHDELIAKHQTYSMFYAPIAIAIYYFALRDKRQNYYRGKMDYLQGLVAGLIMSAVIVVLTPLSQYISHEFISPDYFPNIIHHSVESGQMTREEAEGQFHLQGFMIISSLFAAMMGLLTSVVVALFVRN